MNYIRKCFKRNSSNLSMDSELIHRDMTEIFTLMNNENTSKIIIVNSIINKIRFRTNSEYVIVWLKSKDCDDVYDFYAFTNIAWNETTWDFCLQHYTEQHPPIRLTSMDNIIGWGILNNQIVISNDVLTDPRAKKVMPKGHPPIYKYMGIPIFNDGKMIAMLGLANKPDDYDYDILENIGFLLNILKDILLNYK